MAEQKDARAPGNGEGEGQAEGDGKPQSRLSSLAGWVLVPGLFGLFLFGLGAYVGVHHPELWLTRLTRWFTG